MNRVVTILILVAIVVLSGGCDHFGLNPERFKETEKPIGAFHHEVNALEDRPFLLF